MKRSRRSRRRKEERRKTINVECVVRRGKRNEKGFLLLLFDPQLLFFFLVFVLPSRFLSLAFCHRLSLSPHSTHTTSSSSRRKTQEALFLVWFITLQVPSLSLFFPFPLFLFCLVFSPLLCM